MCVTYSELERGLHVPLQQGKRASDKMVIMMNKGRTGPLLYLGTRYFERPKLRDKIKQEKQGGKYYKCVVVDVVFSD